MSKFFLFYCIIGIVLLPLLYLFSISIEAGFVSENALGALFINEKLFNSFLLASCVSIMALVNALGLALVYYHISSKKIRYLFVLALFFLFCIAPIIYASLFSSIKMFYLLSPFIRSVLVLFIWLSPLATLLLIAGFYTIDKSGLEFFVLLDFEKFQVTKEIVFRQILFVMIGVLCFLWLMVFVQEEVPSFFGYRTYAEEFLSRIVLQERFTSTMFYALVFVLLALGAFFLFYRLFGNKQWNSSKIFVQPLESLNFIIPKKLMYLLVSVVFLFVIFIFVILVSQLNFSLFWQQLEENTGVMINSLLVASFASIVVLLVCEYIIESIQKVTTVVLLICITSLYWLLPSSLISLVLVQFSQQFYSISDIYMYGFLVYGYVLRILPIGLGLLLILSIKQRNRLTQHMHISSRNIFWKLTLPMQYKNWLIVFGILFFLVLNEISTTVLLVPPGFETMVVKIYNLLHYGDFSQVVFLSLMQITLLFCGLLTLIILKGFDDKA